MSVLFIEKQEDLAEGLYANNKDIEKIIINGNVKYIPENCFNNCINLKKVIINTNIYSIEACAFMNCINLNYIDLTNKVFIIKDFAFYNCDIETLISTEDIINDVKFGINNNSIRDYYILPEKDTLNNMSWSEINKICKFNKASAYFNLGDEKEIIINNKIYNVIILDFNHDILADNSKADVYYHATLANTTTANITFGLKECFCKYYPVKPEQNNWKNSELREILNNTNFINKLESDLISSIKLVEKKAMHNSSGKEIDFCYDKIFLLSEGEIVYSESDYTLEGHVYKYYNTDKWNKIIKTLDGIVYPWWLRSISISSPESNIFISEEGKMGAMHFQRLAGISFAFCV